MKDFFSLTSHQRIETTNELVLGWIIIDNKDIQVKMMNKRFEQCFLTNNSSDVNKE